VAVTGLLSLAITWCCRNAGPDACRKAIEDEHLNQALVYQPASRFWPLQWIETGVYLAVALLLSASVSR
jgi:hypothetical protein